MGQTRLHDLRAMSACAPTSDVSLRRTNRRNGSKPGKPRALTTFPICSQQMTLGNGRAVKKPKIVVRSEIYARRDDPPIMRWVSGSGTAERNRTLTGLPPTDFRTSYGLRRLSCAFAPRRVCGLDYSFTLARSRLRCCPSRTWTH